ncbi:hypothetical protein N0V93_005116 [Gnomoniopsis smithogilvyi]|uniref:Vegetatible incompatibility protein HET-E-1 n=1 Tax=Gnomoniopsis smithogilvyi TaxID=1191159 RepID=A0A9W8YTS4_9PEZI|nr:hypothetical protein N0V93_005116 [Gnomoniopsis smithogilvyi]
MEAGTFSARRLDNIKRNKALLEDLGAAAQAQVIQDSAAISTRNARRSAGKRQRVEKSRAAPSRTSARIAATPSKPKYHDDGDGNDLAKGSMVRSRKQGQRRSTGTSIKREEFNLQDVSVDPDPHVDELQASWTSWTPSAPPPTRDEAGFFHFDSHPDFTPNKSPAEVVREGAFGGSYFRPLYSKKLGITIQDDCPDNMAEGLDASYYLTSPTYNPEANKFKVACGQSIEQWEANGWINHQFDVRGWFQWYCRYFDGRRCVDDDRQVSRWKKCVGPTGRWRRMLLKKYMSAGVRTVWDDGEDEDAPEVSPVMHQTCHHWSFEVTQDILDEYWRVGR